MEIHINRKLVIVIVLVFTALGGFIFFLQPDGAAFRLLCSR